MAFRRCDTLEYGDGSVRFGLAGRLHKQRPNCSLGVPSPCPGLRGPAFIFQRLSWRGLGHASEEKETVIGFWQEKVGVVIVIFTAADYERCVQRTRTGHGRSEEEDNTMILDASPGLSPISSRARWRYMMMVHGQSATGLCLMKCSSQDTTGH